VRVYKIWLQLPPAGAGCVAARIAHFGRLADADAPRLNLLSGMGVQFIKNGFAPPMTLPMVTDNIAFTLSAFQPASLLTETTFHSKCQWKLDAESKNPRLAPLEN
jgi:hypothetical protein